MNSVSEKLGQGHEFVQAYPSITAMVAVALLITVTWKAFWRKSVYPSARYANNRIGFQEFLPTIVTGITVGLA